MPRTPSQDDEPSSGVSRVPHRRQDADFHSDEHPEIPRIRRASLHQEMRRFSAEHGAARHASGAPTRRPEDERQDEDEEQEERSAPPAHKIMVALRRRSTVYQPLPVARYRARRRRQYQPPPIIFLLQRHRRSFIVAACALLLFLVCVSLISSIMSHTSSSTLLVIPNQVSSSGMQAADAHKLVLTPPNNGHPAPPVLATSAYLLNADTGATLYAYNPFMHLPMLSTTKLMTALLAVKMGNLNQNITVNAAMSDDLNQLTADSSLMGIKNGETYTLRQLLYGLLLPSGNDAAVVIADALAGSQQAFVVKMNQRATQLGLDDTHYVNPHGLLDTEHYSSAHDLVVLAATVFAIPLIQQITSTREYQIPQTAGHAAHTFINDDQFFWWYPGVNAGKTGWDGAADFIQVISCVRNQHHLIGVVMHTDNWWTDMRDLMNWGFSTFTWVSPRITDAVSAIPYDSDWNYFADDKENYTIQWGNNGRYYVFTGYSISGMIMNYFDKHGALGKFGFPTGEPTVSNNATLLQRFQHATLQCNTNTKQCSSE